MIISGLARALQFLMLLLTLRVATTLLAPAEMGKLSVVTATVAFFVLLLLNPIGMFINRRMHAWNLNGQVRGYLHYFWIYLAAVAAFAMLTLQMLLVFGAWRPGIASSNYVLMVGGSVLFGTLNQFVIPSLNLLGNRIWFAVLTVATTVVSLIFAFVLVTLFEQRAEYWITGLLIGQLVVGVLGLKILMQKLNVTNFDQYPTLNSTKFFALLAFAWPVALAVSLGWVQSQSYRFVVEQHLGLRDLGLFAAGFGISAGITAGFESIIVTYFQPVFYKSVSSGQANSAEDAWKVYAKSVLPSITLTAFLIFALAPELTRLLLGDAYKDSSQYLMWGAIAEWSRIVTGVFALFAHAKMMTKMLIFPNLLGAVLAVVLVWVLIALYGVSGIGPALVLASTGAFALTFYITHRIITIHIPYKEIALIVAMGLTLVAVARLPYIILGMDVSLLALTITTLLTSALFCAFQFAVLRPFIRPSPVGELQHKIV